MPRVLLVDDSAFAREALQAALEPYGLEFGHAEHGGQAIAKAEAARWDLIFLDVVMPVMDGITALRAIRAKGITTPIVLVTSVSTVSTVAAAVKLANVYYVSKPFRHDSIRALAQKLIALDDSYLHAPPRVLLQHRAADLPRRLAASLPTHVKIDATTTLGDSLAAIEEHPHEHTLALFEPDPTADFLDEAQAIAAVLRASVPAAAIFALSPNATITQLTPWRPDGALDGVLPVALEPLGRAFLYATCIRPLVTVVGCVVRAAGFQGAPPYADAYFTMLERELADRCSRIDPELEVVLDLRDIDADPDHIRGLMERMRAVLKAAGGAPTFHITDAVARTLAADHTYLLAA